MIFVRSVDTPARMRKLCLIVFLVNWMLTGMAQQTSLDHDLRRQWDQAVNWFQEGKAALAYPIFLQLSRETASVIQPRVDPAESDYYRLACGVQLDEGAAVEEATRYILRTNPPSYTHSLSYYLADHHFRAQRYPSAQDLIEDIDPRNLRRDEQIHRQFMLGYTHFIAQRFDRALPCFDSVRTKIQHPDYAAANYYFGFLSLRNQQYEVALASLRLVEEHPEYRSIVPYYIGQIYYLQGKKQDAIQYVEKKLSEPGSQYYELPLKQLLGHAYFEKRAFDKALPLLKDYVERAEKVRREDVYELSYCYHQSAQYAACIPGFRELSGGADSLSQHAMYLLGDAYLKTGDLSSARAAFQFCARNNSYRDQREVSLFQYAKLSYELGYLNEARSGLEQFITEYPRSESLEEAQELMVMVLAGTNDFRQALQWVDRIDRPSASLRRWFPRIWYGRAMELMNDQLLERAQILLDQVIRETSSGNWRSMAQFWSGEIAYRRNDPTAAVSFLNDFLSSSNISVGEVNSANARYTLGYAYLRLANYASAGEQFQLITRNMPGQPSALLQDAWLRAGDCQYMRRDFNKAKGYYERAVLMQWPAADYAQFQLALIAGIKNSTEKIRLLQQIADRYPNSTLLPDTYLEIANTWIAERKFREAIPALDQVIARAKQDRWISQALLMQGICWYNLDNYESSLQRLKELVRRFPNSEESDDALENIRQVYVEMGKPAEFVGYMEQIGKPLEYSLADSLTYLAADRLYQSGSSAAALTALEKYLQEHPHGQHRLKAFDQCAGLQAQQKNWSAARMYFDSILTRRPNRYEENAWRSAARISYFEQNDAAASVRYYSGLLGVTRNQEWSMEARRGIVRAYAQLKDWAGGAESARLLIKEKDATSDDKSIAYTVLAKQAQSTSNWTESIDLYRSVLNFNKGALAAEARYQIGFAYTQLGKWADAEKAAQETIRRSGSYEPWVTKSYLLVGDVYFQQKDYFNAKATYQSVLDNAEDPVLQAEAREKLQKVIDAEKQKTKLDS